MMNTAETRLISRAILSPSYWSRMIAMGTTARPEPSNPCNTRSTRMLVKSWTWLISAENTT